MNNTENILEQLLHSFPEERENLLPYVARVKVYKNECGCSMSGAFLVGSFCLLILFGFLFNGFEGGYLMTNALRGTAFVFGAGIVGKLTGIGIARFRLTLLYRHLRARYHLKGS
jgi:hypothetical protein